MSVFHVHLCWFTSFSLMSLISISLSISAFHSISSFSLSFDLFSPWNMDLSISFYLDWMSFSFMSVVLLISSVIIVYSYNYMAPYNNSTYFLWLTTLFVVSMLLVITMSNMLYAMLGWDGLGLVSFFLIVYYQNNSSIVSGIFTLLMNRIGDSFFLLTLVFLFYGYDDFFSFSSSLAPSVLCVLLVLTFMTNSALFPFSPWLPLAIAAPTPISALVHSSTLVTAGLYLMIRFSYVLYSSPSLMTCLLLLSIFTSFYAGLNTLFEVDINKLIALSTLSHLGFIGMAFSAGLLSLAFFHLLVHALFKSLLFITMGDIIINLNHSQDIRYLSNGHLTTPFSSIIMSVSLINLLGLPSLSGFFSNDLVLECMSYLNFSTFIMFIIYFNVLITYYYTYKLFYFSFQSVNYVPFQIMHSSTLLHVVLMFLLSISTLCFTYVFMNFICLSIIYLPLVYSLKFLPLILNLSLFLYLTAFLSLPSYSSNFTSSFFSSIIFLSPLCMTLSSRFYYRGLFTLVHSLEPRFLSHLLHVSPFVYFSPLLDIGYKSIASPHRGLYFSLLIFSFIAVLSLSL